MDENSFFKECKPHSLVKVEIVKKYFTTWANVIIGSSKRYGKRLEKILYFDFFSGPGCYEDGTKSTPIHVLESAIEIVEIRKRFMSFFNDADYDNYQILKKRINSIPKISSLKYKPDIRNIEIEEDFASFFEDIDLYPSLTFIDPFGYKGVTYRLINSVIKDWGCDCILFFNYKRVNISLDNPSFDGHMKALFGDSRLKNLRRSVERMNPVERESKIMLEFKLSIQENSTRYVQWLCFKDEYGTRTSHYLVFVSKNILGYNIMKDIMAKYSSVCYQGVPTFEYNPVEERRRIKVQLLPFFSPRPLDDLKEMLLIDFAGQELTLKNILNDHKHHTDKNYIKKNYKSALMNLEEEGRIIADPPRNKRRRDTFSDSVKITFPLKRG